MYRLEFTGDGRQPPDHKEMEPGVVEQDRTGSVAVDQHPGRFCFVGNTFLYTSASIYRLYKIVESFANLCRLHIWNHLEVAFHI